MVELSMVEYSESATLAAALGALSAPSGNHEMSSRRFVLLDSTGFPSGKDVNKRLTPLCAEGKVPCNLYADFGGHGIADVGPRIAELREDDDVWKTLAELALHECGLNILACEDSWNALSAHLSALREVELPDGQIALFRYQDTQVLSGLFPLLGGRQTDQFLGPVSCWLTINNCGQAYRLSRTQPYKRMITRPLRLRQEQLTRLDRYLLPLTVASQVEATDSSLLAGMRPCAVQRLMRDRVAVAEEWGLDLPSDISLFCVLSLQLPDGFEYKAPFAAALKGAANKTDTFGNLLERVTSAEWDAWDREMASL